MKFKSSEIRVLQAEEFHKVEKLLSQASMSGSGIELSCERKPDVFFLPLLKAKSSMALGFWLKDELCGFALLITEKRFVNASPRDVWSLSRVFINEEGRGKGFLLWLTEYLPAQQYVANKLGYAFTLVGNRSVEKYLERSFRRFPHIPHFNAELYNVSSIRPSWGMPRLSSKIEIQKASENDSSTILKLLKAEQKGRFLGKVWDKEQLYKETLERPSSTWTNWWIAKDKKGVCGILYAWEGSQCNINRMQGLDWTTRLFIRIWNCIIPLLGGLKLPTEGEEISMISLHDICLLRNQTEVLKSLIASVGRDARQKGIPLLLMASDRNDPNLSIFSSPLGYRLESHLLLFGEAFTDLSKDDLHYCDSDLF